LAKFAVVYNENRIESYRIISYHIVSYTCIVFILFSLLFRWIVIDFVVYCWRYTYVSTVILEFVMSCHVMSCHLCMSPTINNDANHRSHRQTLLFLPFVPFSNILLNSTIYINYSSIVTFHFTSSLLFDALHSSVSSSLLKALAIFRCVCRLRNIFVFLLFHCIP